MAMPAEKEERAPISGAERVRRHRERKRNVTPEPVTLQAPAAVTLQPKNSLDPEYVERTNPRLAEVLRQQAAEEKERREREFDWQRSEKLIEHRSMVAVYLDEYGDLHIGEDGCGDCEDPHIIVRAEDIDGFVFRLKAFVAHPDEEARATARLAVLEQRFARQQADPSLAGLSIFDDSSWEH